VVGVTFSDTDSAPVSKFLNPGPAILQIWESDSCSDSSYNHHSNRNLPMFLPEKWPHRLLPMPKLKSDAGSGPGFSQIFDSESRSEQKPQNPVGVDSGSPNPVPNLVQACNVNIEDEWTQCTALSTISKTKRKSETFTWYCSTHVKCEINDAHQHKRKIEEVFYQSAHGKWQIKEVLQNKRQT